MPRSTGEATLTVDRSTEWGVHQRGDPEPSSDATQYSEERTLKPRGPIDSSRPHQVLEQPQTEEQPSSTPQGPDSISTFLTTNCVGVSLRTPQLYQNFSPCCQQDPSVTSLAGSHGTMAQSYSVLQNIPGEYMLNNVRSYLSLSDQVRSQTQSMECATD